MTFCLEVLCLASRGSFLVRIAEAYLLSQLGYVTSYDLDKKLEGALKAFRTAKVAV